MIYKSVETLPITIYFKILENVDNVKLLVKKGKIPSIKILNKYWDQIKNEFSKLDPKKEDQVLLDAMKTICRFRNMVLEVDTASSILKYEPNESLSVNVLSEYSLNINNPDKIIEAKKGWEIKINEQKEIIQKIINLDSDIEPVNINNVLASMSAALKIPFNFNKITCVEFVSYKNILRKN